MITTSAGGGGGRSCRPCGSEAASATTTHLLRQLPRPTPLCGLWGKGKRDDGVAEHSAGPPGQKSCSSPPSSHAREPSYPGPLGGSVGRGRWCTNAWREERLKSRCHPTIRLRGDRVVAHEQTCQITKKRSKVIPIRLLSTNTFTWPPRSVVSAARTEKFRFATGILARCKHAALENAFSLPREFGTNGQRAAMRSRLKTSSWRKQVIGLTSSFEIT